MGMMDKISGRAKKAAGDLTGDPNKRREGSREEQKGEAKQEATEAQQRAEEKSRKADELDRGA